MGHQGYRQTLRAIGVDAINESHESSVTGAIHQFEAYVCLWEHRFDVGIHA